MVSVVCSVAMAHVRSIVARGVFSKKGVGSEVGILLDDFPVHLVLAIRSTFWIKFAIVDPGAQLKSHDPPPSMHLKGPQKMSERANRVMAGVVACHRRPGRADLSQRR